MALLALRTIDLRGLSAGVDGGDSSVVVQALGDPPRLRIDRLDFQSGRVLAHQDVTLRNAFLATLSNLLPVRDGMVFRAATRLARLTPTGEVRLEDPET